MIVSDDIVLISPISSSTLSLSQVRQISVPTEWENFDENSTSSVANLVPLATSHPKYMEIANAYKSSGGKGTIQKIEQVQAPDLWFRYAQCRSAMPGKSVEKWCWHGCSRESASSILGLGTNSDGGFDWRFCGTFVCGGRYHHHALSPSLFQILTFYFYFTFSLHRYAWYVLRKGSVLCIESVILV